MATKSHLLNAKNREWILSKKFSEVCCEPFLTKAQFSSMGVMGQEQTLYR